jgi:polyhydroxyalkanoate synthesis regulator phasin
LKEFIKKAFFLGLGALVLTEERLRQVIEDLVKKGKLSKEEGQSILGEALNRIQQTKKELEEKIDSLVQQAFKKANVPTRQELEALEDRIKKLEEKIKIE